MDMQIIYLVLVVLCLSVALNLKLTFDLLRLIRNPPEAEDPLAHLVIGDVIPEVQGQLLSSGTQTALPLPGKPQVLLFLSSRCPVCKEKLQEIGLLYPFAQDAGVEFSFITLEAKDKFTDFLQSPVLSAVAVSLEASQYKLLNPALSSPFYLFVDHEQKLQTGGTVGDEDWQGFASQLSELSAQEQPV